MSILFNVQIRGGVLVFGALRNLLKDSIYGGSIL